MTKVVPTLLLIVLASSGCARDEEPRFRPRRSTVHAEDRHAEADAPRRNEERQPRRDEARPARQEPVQPGIVEVQQPAPAPELLNPQAATERAPDEYVVRLETSEGPVEIEVHREWAPQGADRFYNLVRLGYFTDVMFFRVISGFMAQTGIHGDPRVSAAWRSARIPDDPVTQSNRRGFVTFATSGPNSRTTQFFINLVDNTNLDGMGFAPFGRVRDMQAVDRLHSGYGEGAPRGAGPAQPRIQSEGNAYLRAEFPELDSIRSASIVSPQGRR